MDRVHSINVKIHAGLGIGLAHPGRLTQTDDLGCRGPQFGDAIDVGSESFPRCGRVDSKIPGSIAMAAEVVSRSLMKMGTNSIDMRTGQSQAGEIVDSFDDGNGIGHEIVVVDLENKIRMRSHALVATVLPLLEDVDDFFGSARIKDATDDLGGMPDQAGGRCHRIDRIPMHADDSGLGKGCEQIVHLQQMLGCLQYPAPRSVLLGSIPEDRLQACSLPRVAKSSAGWCPVVQPILIVRAGAGEGERFRVERGFV